MEDLEQRFWRLVSPEPNSGCWLWEGAQSRGYGMIKLSGKKNIYATHAAMMLYGTPRPDGALACHHCDVSLCVNPAHLYWGTDRTNAEDRISRGRAVNLRGEDHGMAVLTLDQVQEIKSSHDGPTIIARRLGIKLSAVEDIRYGRSWKWV